MEKDNQNHRALARAVFDNLLAEGVNVDAPALQQAVARAATAADVTYGGNVVSERVLRLMKGDESVSIGMPPAAHPQGAPCEFALTAALVERLRGHLDTGTVHLPVLARWPDSARVQDTVLSFDLEGFSLKGTGPGRFDTVQTARLGITGLIKALVTREPRQGIRFGRPAN